MGHEFKFEVIPLDEAVAHPVFTVDEEEENPVVLIVDDEPLIVDSLAAILSSAGLTVLKAYNAVSALEIAMQSAPDLLLTDVAMPGMNGIELAMTLSNTFPSCRVLLFSAHAVALDLNKARAAGFDFPLLTKPLHPREMLREIFASLDNKPAPRKPKPHSTYTEAPQAALWRLTPVNG